GPALVRRRERRAQVSCPPHARVGGRGRPGTPPPRHPFPRPSLEPSSSHPPRCRSLAAPPPPLLCGWSAEGEAPRGQLPAASCTQPTHAPRHVAPDTPTGGCTGGGWPPAGVPGRRESHGEAPHPDPHRPVSDRPTSTPAGPDAGVGTGGGGGRGTPMPSHPPHPAPNPTPT